MTDDPVEWYGLYNADSKYKRYLSNETNDHPHPQENVYRTIKRLPYKLLKTIYFTTIGKVQG
jgi:hypothetical protein